MTSSREQEALGTLLDSARRLRETTRATDLAHACLTGALALVEARSGALFRSRDGKLVPWVSDGSLPAASEDWARRALPSSEPIEQGHDDEHGPWLAVALPTAPHATVLLLCDPARTDEQALAALGLHAATSGRMLELAGQAAEQLEERTRLQVILESSADAIVTTDRTGRITYFSPGAADLFGHGPEVVIGHPVAEFYVGGEAAARKVQLHLQDSDRVRNLEMWFKSSKGRDIPASLTASLLRDADGEVLGTLGILKDITIEKKLENRLSQTIEMLQDANETLGRLAVTDSLSGLNNRRSFHQRLDDELRRAERHRRPVSLLMLDIDRFKRFNDDHGHQVGDRVIQELGRTVLESIRKIDHGCRYGGEEFTIILPETSRQSALVVAQRLREGFRSRHAWSELSMSPPTLSIGIADTSEVAGESPEEEPAGADAELIRRADEAMYRAKHRGGDEIELSSE
ncbi:MAG: diguanylate cyclase [Acidobacteriota bacterium]